MAELGIFAGLFAVAFLAATILPAQSELGLGGLMLSGNHDVVLLVVVAAAGNTLRAHWCGMRAGRPEAPIF